MRYKNSTADIYYLNLPLEIGKFDNYYSLTVYKYETGEPFTCSWNETTDKLRACVGSPLLLDQKDFFKKTGRGLLVYYSYENVGYKVLIENSLDNKKRYAYIGFVGKRSKDDLIKLLNFIETIDVKKY
ncbi:hypothetical protein HY030_03070 [Candidatus Gottesmanbacteria bacterium]|nr:hypothetical protein [Candidatus Gottesmanbacteria bacterium]